MDTFFDLRQKMVAEQIEFRGIRDPRVLAAMRQVPRHRFVSSDQWDHAYADGPQPTGFGQTISQPYIVALMTSLLHLQGTEKILEIGTGSGYQAAILSLLAREVFTIELYPELAERARGVLRELGVNNVMVFVADGSGGLPAQAPFQGTLNDRRCPSASPARARTVGCARPVGHPCRRQPGPGFAGLGAQAGRRLRAAPDRSCGVCPFARDIWLERK